MMTTINDYFEQAQLAQAAYAQDLQLGWFGGGIAGNPSDYAAALIANGMSETQAITFANEYTVISQSPSTIHGFSATLFQDSSGQQYLSIRGTQTDFGFIIDGIVDVSVMYGLNGFAQYVELKEFYQSLVDSGVVNQSSLNVTGHSLGGLLAQMFAVDFSMDVNQVLTYNAPGIGGIGAELLELAGIIEQPNVPLPYVENIIAEQGIELTAGLGTLLGSVQYVFIEDAGIVEGNVLVKNHSISRLADSLAVYDLLYQADNDLNLKQITATLEVSSNEAENSLESVVTVLGELLVTDYKPLSSNEYDEDRDQLYKDYVKISDAIDGAQTVYGVELLFNIDDADGSLTLKPESELKAQAVSDKAFGYALVEGNLFALTWHDYTTVQGYVDGQYDIYEPGASGDSVGQLTEQYIADRVAYLSEMLTANLQDTDDTGTDIRYEDLADRDDPGNTKVINEPAVGNPNKAVYDLLSTIDPSLAMGAIAEWTQKAVSATGNSSLEASVFAVGNPLCEQFQSTKTSREELYKNTHKLTAPCNTLEHAA